MNEHPDEQAINEIADALKQVLAVKPQLLFKALEKCGSAYMLDCIQAELQNKEKLASVYRYRGGMCLGMTRLLLQSGRAQLDTDDVTNIGLYLRLRNDVAAKDAPR